ncbi:MAG TPA: peptidylprolyl isomerase [Candidatus Paceibacterota bacterium]
MKNTQQGYIGIVLLLLGVLGVGLFAFRTDLFTGNKGDENIIEQGMNDIDKAQEVKDAIEQNNQKIITEEVVKKEDQKIIEQNNNKKIMQAILHTSKGDITIEFNEATPKTVENFVKLAKEGFYNGTKFHRVIKGFMSQGGDPLSKDDSKSAYWGTGGPGYSFNDEITATNKNDKYTISMANAGANTNGSQFFINATNNNFLDTKHTVFGKVVAGASVADAINNVATGPNDRPVEAVVITSVDLK